MVDLLYALAEDANTLVIKLKKDRLKIADEIEGTIDQTKIKL